MGKDRKEYFKAYREANKEKINEYFENNKENRKEYFKTYREANKEKINQQRRVNKPKEKKVKTPEQLAEYRKQYYLANKEKFKGDADKRNARFQERKANEPLFKLKTNIRQLIRSTIQNKGYKKSNKSEQILGCTFEQFKLHLESQFESWMSWDNYGNPKDNIYELNKTWDIDHIIPINRALTEEEVIKLNHYTNLKPLCSYINRFIKRGN